MTASAPRYSVIPRVLVVATHQDELLLIRRSDRKKLWPGLVNPPGGHIEIGENPLQAAHRELREETGLTASDMRLRGTLLTDGPQPHTGILIFVFRADVQRAPLRASEEGTPFWLGRAQLHTVPTLPDLPQLLSLTLDHATIFHALKIDTPAGEQLQVTWESQP